MTTQKILADWVNCQKRGSIIRNDLSRRIQDFRKSADKARNAYTQDFMGEPCRYFADACDAAADVLQERLDAIQKDKQ